MLGRRHLRRLHPVLNEDPWERLRTFRTLLPNSRLQMLLRGQNLLGYRHYGDDVVDHFVERAAENGMDVFRVFDALNDTRNVERAIAAVKKTGKHAQGTICYTTSPLHTVERAREEDRWGDVHAFPGLTNIPSNGICRSLGFALVGEQDVVFSDRVLRANHWRIDPQKTLTAAP